MKKITGIYKIQSKIKPSRIYIGSAIDVLGRWSRHLQELKTNIHHSRKLQNHYNKYGKDDLEFSVLSGCTKEDLLRQEQFYLDSYSPYFNTCKIAGSSLGIRHTEETKRKMSQIAKNRPPVSEETRQKISQAGKGRPQSEESRRKKSESLKGRPGPFLGKHLSEETKRKIAERHKGMTHSEESKRKIGEASRFRNKGSKNPNYGKHLSLETRIKLSKANKNPSEETRRKMRESGKVKIFTEEHKRHLSEGHRGKTLSEEAKQKRRDKMKAA